MGIVVVGGHSRNIGKTSVVCGLLAAMPERHWTAIKITQCEHAQELCECALDGEASAITEEHDSGATTDSSRYLAAGASRSLWVRARRDRFAEAMSDIRAEIAGTENVIVESNCIVEFVEPEMYVSVLDPHVADFKASALRYLFRADAILVLPGLIEQTAWPEGTLGSIEHIAQFHLVPPDYAPKEFVEFVAQKLSSRRR